MDLGDKWAYREKAYTKGSPVIAVEILQLGPPKSHKVRVKFLEGEFSGLDQWVPKIRLRVPWHEVDAWLRDERLYLEARKASGESVSHVVREAAYIATEGYAVPDGFHITYPDEELPIAEIHDLPAFASALRLDPEELLREPHAFIDRFGTYVAPWLVALRLAKRVAEVLPDELLAKVAAEEQKLQHEAVYGLHFEYGRGETSYISPERCAEWLRRKQPAFTLVREWCGTASVERFDEVEALRAEVHRLRSLVETAAARLDQSNHPRIARQLLKELHPPSNGGRSKA